jgi:tripartite-type tricarboxylate transporter receptor subunit TctC
MYIPRRGFLRLSAGAAVLPVASRIAQAETYPARPITIVVGASAGGPTDTIGRIITERMRMTLGTTIVIENNGSAAGSIAHGRVARAAPDGYTLSLGHWGTHVVNGAVYALTYDVFRDFEPVALISSNPYLMVGRLALPVGDLAGLVAWLKANSGTATQGTSGAGSPGHIGGIMLQSILGATWQFIPYRGANPVMQDLVAGQFDFTFTPPDQGMPQIRAGRIKVFAVSANKRLGIAPDVPTTDEAGLPGFYLSYWHGLWAPRGTAKDIVARLNAAVVEALADAGVRARLAELGQQVYPREQQTPEALATLQKADIDKWWPMIKAANIRAE